MAKDQSPAKIDSVNRRGLLRLAAGGMIALPFASSLAACTQADTPVADAISQHMQLISEVAELVIPETDTPGATQAGVPEYIAMILSDWLNPEDSEAMIAGLVAFDDAAAAQGAEAFLAASPDQKAAALTAMEAEHAPAFLDLKQMIVFGYCTSEAATELLNYDPVPGPLSACLSLEEAGPAAMLYGH
ncbi:MAG: gluconate 2-dehydrogenase subunit 3 family protein [Pseudomonadota bacterium]